ncbi:zinc knuckle protein, partial [Aphelenchoides avenae]
MSGDNYGYETVEFSDASSSRTDNVREHRVLMAEDQQQGAQLATGQVIAGKSVGAFDPKAMPWEVYEELLRYRLEVRGITDEKAKKLVVITEIGPKAYMELKNALAGKALKDVASADELLMLMQKRYSPKKLLIAERHKRLLLGQDAGQSLAEFYSRIQEAADCCDFRTSEVREMMVLQVFVKGIRSEGTRATLLQKEKLKPQEALELAQVLEMAESEAHGMAGASGHGQLGVDRVSKPQGTFKKNGARGKSGSCRHCGDTGHGSENCRFRNETCHYCNKKGHIKKVCRNRQAGKAEDGESGNSGYQKGK